MSDRGRDEEEVALRLAGGAAQSADGDGDGDGPILDELTRVYSIQYFEHQLRAEVAYSLRHDMPLSLVLIAVDHLSDLTDMLGAEAPGRLLSRVAEAVQEYIRAEDVLARYGVGELAVLCRGIPIQPAAYLGTRVRQAVEATRLSHRGMELPITVSVGVASLAWTAEEGTAMVPGAEGALARARVDGNCVIVAEDGPPKE